MIENAHARVVSRYNAFMRVGQDAPYSASDACSLDEAATVFFIGATAGNDLFDPVAAPVYRLERGGEPVKLHPGPASILRLSKAGRLALAIGGDAAHHLIVMTAQGEVEARIAAPGRIEHLQWSPDGTRLLLLVAGSATDSITAAGAMRGETTPNDAAKTTWAPTIDDGGPQAEDWRRAFVFRLGETKLEPAPTITGMIWTAAWIGETALALLRSEQAGEAAWYQADLGVLDLQTGLWRRLHQPRDQIDHVVASPDGAQLAFVEAVASDRGLVCGVLKVIDLRSGALATIDTAGVEVGCVTWRDNGVIHLAGQRGLETVVGDHDLSRGTVLEFWSSVDWGCSGYMAVSRPAGGETALLVLESFSHGPRLALIRPMGLEIVHVLDPHGEPCVAAARAIRWAAPDGVEIEGLLIQGRDAVGPQALVVDVHGGPVWAYRASWLARMRATPLLVEAGYAVLCPNPRGSFGRGQDFARAVIGDMGGRESFDLLSGVDHLIATQVADPARIGLVGSSYGGYMAAWLPKLRSQIAAAVAISPVTNWFSQHWTTNIPFFDALFLGGSPVEQAARYLERSPALRPERTRAATLILAGVLDRCTPIGQAIELHRALLEAGSTSVLASYPEEGHGLRGPRGYIDSAARILDWFERFMPA